MPDMPKRWVLPLALALAVAPLAHATEEVKKSEGEKPAAEGKAEAKEGKKEGGTGAASSSVPTTPTVLLPSNERVFSPAEVAVLTDLEAKRVELERRAQALELREKLADLMERRLADKTKELQTLKGQIEQLMTGLSGKGDKDLTQLAQMYAAMKPAAAAIVLNRLDNSIVHDVLMRMPVKKSGKIMEALDPVKARVVSEMMATNPVAGDNLSQATSPNQAKRP
jgi:flagellar motility protein MotE (MotC chaperone)